MSLVTSTWHFVVSGNVLLASTADGLTRSKRTTTTVNMWTSGRMILNVVTEDQCYVPRWLYADDAKRVTAKNTEYLTNITAQCNAQYLRAELDRSLEESKTSDCSVCLLGRRRSSDPALTGRRGRMHSDRVCQVCRLNSKQYINLMQICSM